MIALTPLSSLARSTVGAFLTGAVLLAAGAMLLLATPAVAKTSSFSIAPLGSVLTVKEGGRQAQEVFNISNTGNSDVTLDVEVVAWSQDSRGASMYEETKDFLVYPKTLTVKAKQTRAVRLMRRSGQEAPATQRYYRVQFRELAPSFKPSETKDQVQVAIVTRVLLPLVLQAEGFADEPVFEVRQGPNALHVRNTGRALVKFSSAHCDGKRVAGLLYIHPGVTSVLPGVSCNAKLVVNRENLGDTEHEVLPLD